MSCNCSEKLGMSFFVHQRIWIAATRLVSHWCSGIKLWCLKFKFKFLFQVGVLILCLSSMLKHTIYVIMGWKINRAVFSVFSKVLLIHYSLTMFSLLNRALGEPVFNKHRKKSSSWNFAEIFIFLFQVTGVVITYFTLLYQLEWGDILIKYRSISPWTFFKFSSCVWTNKRQMDHYLLILVDICVEQWAETPWHIFLLTGWLLLGGLNFCLDVYFFVFLFFFADNEMVMNCWLVMQSFLKPRERENNLRENNTGFSCYREQKKQPF